MDKREVGRNTEIPEKYPRNTEKYREIPEKYRDKRGNIMMKFTELLKKWIASREEYLKYCNESWAQPEYVAELLATMQSAEDEVNGIIERLQALETLDYLKLRE